MRPLDARRDSGRARVRPRFTPRVAGTRIALSLVGVAVAATVAGCGGSSHGSPSGVTPQSFAWARESAPASWPRIRIPSGAELVYPPGWHPAHGDSGTATAVRLDASGHFRGYLNLTPRQGNERLASWPSFRVDHERDEGDRSITPMARDTTVHFRAGRGSCVQDRYVTRTGARYVELACLVLGSRTASVIVGAAPPDDWPRMSGAI